MILLIFLYKINIPINIFSLINQDKFSNDFIEENILKNWFNKLNFQKKINDFFFFNFNFTYYQFNQSEYFKFEDIILQFTRNSRDFTSKIIHPFVLQQIFNSIKKFYNLNGYTFFLFKNNNLKICEGLLIPFEGIDYLQNQNFFNYNINNKWFNDIFLKKLINETDLNFLNKWNSELNTFNNLNNNNFLNIELNRSIYNENYQCNSYWISNKRFFFFNINLVNNYFLINDKKFLLNYLSNISNIIYESINSFIIQKNFISLIEKNHTIILYHILNNFSQKINIENEIQNLFLNYFNIKFENKFLLINKFE